MKVAYKPVTAPMIRSLADGLDKAAHQLMLAAVKMENAAVRDIDFHWVTAANLYGPKIGMPVSVQSVPKTVTKKNVLSDVSVTMIHVVVCFLIIMGSFVFSYATHDGMRDEKSEAALFTAMSTTILMAPAFIAGVRRHPFVLPIYVISFFLGWTCVAWIGVAIWAVWPIKRA